MEQKDDHADAKTLNILTSFLKNLPKESPKMKRKNKCDSESSPGKSTVTSRTGKQHSKSKHVQNQQVDDNMRSKNTQDKGKKKKDNINSKQVATKRTKENLNTSRSKKRKVQVITDISPIKQSNLDSFLNKSSNVRNNSKSSKFACSSQRSESSDSCELPIFKTSKNSVRKRNDKSSFKKYDFSTPSVDEILRDKKDLERHKHQMETFQHQALCNTSFELPFSTKDFDNPLEVNGNILDCKNLALDDITKMFKSNLNHLSNVINGKIYNERHERYHDKNNRLFTLTPRDLSYSTSMIVFSFEQKEHMLSLLSKEFDPTDNKTHYFFQVLLPELCLRIFMETHQMSLEEAVIYLEERPINE